MMQKPISRSATQRRALRASRSVWKQLAALMSACAAALAITLAPTAAYAVPNPDTVIPTSNYSPECYVSFPDGTVCKTDNASVYYYMDSVDEYKLESDDRAIVTNSINRYQPTDLTITYDSTPVFTGEAETDVIYQEGSTGFPNWLNGLTWCNGRDPGTLYECDQTYIRIRAGMIGYRIATHESGHAFGLLHGNESAPRKDQCASIMGVMRADLACPGFTTADLGSTIITNINYSY